jgi:hypothetical protein
MEKTLGRWPKMQQGSKTSMVELPPQNAADPLDAAVDKPVDNSAGDDSGMTSEAPGMTPSTGGAGTGPVKTTTAPDAGKPTAAPRLTFSVLTEAKYTRVGLSDPSFDDNSWGPKNIGAIWVSKPDGSFVRSLQLWRQHKDRSRHLVAYNKACECPKPDVVATATLPKHKEHMASWDMTDREGKPVPEGQYTLHIEVSEYDVSDDDRVNKDAQNAQWSMDFDTKTAPNKLMPQPTEYFTNLKLELLKP